MQEIYHFRREANENKVLGPENINLDLICELYHAEINIGFAKVYLKEKDIFLRERLAKLFSFFERLLDSGINFTTREIIAIKAALDNHAEEEMFRLYHEKKPILSLYSGKTIYPMTLNQEKYIRYLQENDIIIATGPAGTGKTYLAILFAAAELKRQRIKKIVLVRPAVEAGERLGFLPGDLKEKIDPYLIPLYDALDECFGKETVAKNLEKGTLEVASLAYMRGRTLDNAVIILDEAQNTTGAQMLMFLTRLGFNSKMIITGDITQIDLPSHKESGLIEAIKILKNIKKIAQIEFSASDVMRHPLVYEIINRYAKKGTQNEN